MNTDQMGVEGKGSYVEDCRIVGMCSRCTADDSPTGAREWMLGRVIAIDDDPDDGSAVEPLACQSQRRR
jgi:hypothetical protein